MNDPTARIESLEERIRCSPDISEDDRESLLRFSREMKLRDSRYGDHRREKLLRHCTRISENVGGISAALTERKAAEDIVLWIRASYDNENTKHDYRTAVRVLGGLLTDGPIDQKPDSIAWIPSGTSSSYNPVPDPAEMLTWDDDISPMTEAAHNARDAALIAVAWDAGARSGELKDLTIGDVTDHEHGLQIRVDGKTGQRSVVLIPSIPYLNQWLHGGSAGHPAPNDPDAPLWSKLNVADPITYRRFRDIFDEVAQRADISKPVTPTNFRKSNATFLARRGMNEAYIDDRQGRKRGSKATAHYVARFGGDSDKQYAKLHGADIEESKPKPTGPITCPRCEKPSPRDQSSCISCGQLLDHEAAESIRSEQKELRTAVLRLVRGNPELLSDYEQARDLLTIFENNPQLFQEANQFTEAISES